MEPIITRVAERTGHRRWWNAHIGGAKNALHIKPSLRKIYSSPLVSTLGRS